MSGLDEDGIDNANDADDDDLNPKIDHRGAEKSSKIWAYVERVCCVSPWLFIFIPPSFCTLRLLSFPYPISCF
jgi:hypothetical protein